MLLLHQAGNVKVGEVVRYSLTYTPANDRILPTPSHLHVKVKNTAAIPLRAAWVHGPYTLHVAAYPQTFNPYHKTEDPARDGEPQYEPMLKAHGSWQAKLVVPEDIRETGADLGKRRQSSYPLHDGVAPADSEGKGSVTWIIEIASQILFSNSASVSFEFLAGRDERSLDLGFAAVAGHGHGGPGQVQNLATDKDKKRARERGHVQTAGVYSKAVRLVVEDTEVLWDKPPLPTWDDLEDEKQRESMDTRRQSKDTNAQSKRSDRKKKKIHLVVLTHGLHSNIGADMLYLKESIDATVKQARLDAKQRKESYRAQQENKPAETSGNTDGTDGNGEATATAPLSGGQEDLESFSPDAFDDEEETIVRGFPGNAVRTENGIQYLGKRLAKYILRFTYPDQPYLPIKKPLTKTLTDPFKSEQTKAARDGMPSHAGSSIHNPDDGTTKKKEELAYEFTSISFVGHSLGGLIQTYAIAYIHKHNPDFFTQIKPVNFICMASPMLGLSNENPMYVRFALDFGLVGRTGQDLGLTWRPPTIARGGWNAMIGGLGSGSQKEKEQKSGGEGDPSAKPLLRILPTGPAHQVLRMFRNRTVYSNVVNDGIVPLRTSCLLFLDWRGLGKVDKARRENGLIGTVAEWGWAELTGQNLGGMPERVASERIEQDEDEDDEHVRAGEGESVPLPDEDETAADARRLTTRDSYDDTVVDEAQRDSFSSDSSKKNAQNSGGGGMWDNFLSFFRSSTPPPERTGSNQSSKKTKKALRRGQTIEHEDSDDMQSRARSGTMSNPTIRPHLPHAHSAKNQGKRPPATRGDSLVNNETGEPEAPPKTSIFESAGDILHPPLPSREWITDPSSRRRTIFHDRVYHPDDIPPPPAKRQGSRFARSFGSEGSLKSTHSQDPTDPGTMKVEEKIARAYHRDLSWRKVLVSLEPDAHNNMIVRRMFANAYGWSVVKHVCDTHFALTHAANTRDEYEPARERAKNMNEPIPEHGGEEVAEQTAIKVPKRTQSEMREASDELRDLQTSRDGASGSYSSKIAPSPSSLSRQSTMWDDAWFEGADGDDDSDIDERNLVSRLINPMPVKKPEPAYKPSSPPPNGELRTPTTPYTDGHRGLSPTTSRSPSSYKSVASTKPTFDAANVDPPYISNKILSAEPEEVGGSTAEMGLRKSVSEQMQRSPTASKSKKAASEPAKADGSPLAEALKDMSTTQD